ncbi:alpha/beta hydrolase-fold protein [uncultured Tenacibaculum sp.]|uniref:alpha/beta hydrolase-fold protein n=1 Tax=uncultured Tenacibaculum sp. TaxID=174713 RepID=UPI0026395457|nr:alpha/beta hydrolase-fold protein [uncultured Tenacibaculum sp.]
MTKLITPFIALFFIASIHAQQQPTSTPINQNLGKEFKMQSSILKEERTLMIHTPEGYATSKKNYPVVYVLDGNNHFNHATNAATLLSENQRMPESIVVAIPNNQGTRRRDLGNGRDNFKKYIKTEVIPFVNKNYRTTEHKTIFGHSMAGAFVLNYLATEPSLFENYIAASPVVQIFNSELLTKFQELFNNNKNLDQSLYFTITDATAEGQRATDALNKLVTIFKKEAPKSLDWKYDFIENQVHMTTPYLTMYKGFTEVFNDFQAPRYSSYQNYKDRGGMEKLKSHYTKRAKKYNTENKIPENTMARLATVLLNDKQEKKAISILKQATKDYPESMRAYNRLARAYEETKELKKAEEAYKTALSIANKQASPNSNYFKKQLKRLQG